MNEFEIVTKTLHRHQKSILIGCFIGVALSILITVFQKPTYQAEMIVAPTERTGVPSLSSFLPKSAADAPALQYFVERIDASQSTDFTTFETVILSPYIHSQADKNIVPPYKQLKKNMRIKPVGLTQFRKIILRGKNKNQLIPTLNTLFRLTDQSIRNNKKAKTTRRITYLNEQLKNTFNPDHRNAIIALLKEQEQTAMMVSIDNNFAADIIDPAHILEKPITPNLKILLPLLMVIGGFIGFIISGFYKK